MAAELSQIKYFLLDMDGTIYLDRKVFDGTLDFLAKLKKQGKRAFYISNNSSKSASSYVEKLENLGIPATVEDFFTSGQLTADFLQKEKAGASLFLLGTPDLEEYMKSRGFTLVKKYDKNVRPDFVVLGFDTTMTYEKLRDACHYIKEGVPFWATHPDDVCPYTEDFAMPDNGSFFALIKVATKKDPDFVVGKPNPFMIDKIVETIGCKRSEMAVVGDRLNTDIASGINAKINTILVLTGDTNKEMLEASPIKPDYVFENIRELEKLI